MMTTLMEVVVDAPRVFEKPYPVIGNDVWLGQNVTLNRGVNIGDGTAVAAFSVVTKDVPPYTTVGGGNPAKGIRQRCRVELIERLQASRWWEFRPKEFGHLDMRNVEDMPTFFESHDGELEPFEPPVLRYDDRVELG